MRPPVAPVVVSTHREMFGLKEICLRDVILQNYFSIFHQCYNSGLSRRLYRDGQVRPLAAVLEQRDSRLENNFLHLHSQHKHNCKRC